MSARTQLFETAEPITLKLFGGDSAPAAEPSVRRIAYPPYAPADEGDDDLAAFGRRIAAEFQDAEVSPEQQRRATTDLTVAEFYTTWMLADRTREKEPATLKKDEQALDLLDRFGIPAGWPAGRQWHGPPIGCVTAGWLAGLFGEALAAGLAPATVRNRGAHLKGMLARAAELGLMSPLKVSLPTYQPEGHPFTAEQATAAYRSLRDEPALQIAFVVCLATGARFSDLFWLRWEDFDLDRQTLSFVPYKTATKNVTKHQRTGRTTVETVGRRIVLPVSPTAWKHVQRFTHRTGPLFDGWVHYGATDRNNNRMTHRVNDTFRQLTGLGAAEWRTPWHSARATAANWIEDVAPAFAAKLLGHAAKGVTEQHYLTRRVTPEFIAAVRAVRWPAAFAEISRPDRPTQRRLFD